LLKRLKTYNFGCLSSKVLQPNNFSPQAFLNSQKSVSLRPFCEKFIKMDSLIQFNIPVSGLKDKVHLFDFKLGKSFFQCFSKSPIKDGNIEVQLEFDKRPELYVLTFDIKGTVKAICDRCLEEFDLPLHESQSLLVKFDKLEHEEAEVVYILEGTKKLNVAKYIYEFVNLATPLIKTHDKAGEECKKDMLSYLSDYRQEKVKAAQNPVWSALKKFDVK